MKIQRNFKSEGSSADVNIIHEDKLHTPLVDTTKGEDVRELLRGTSIRLALHYEPLLVAVEIASARLQSGINALSWARASLYRSQVTLCSCKPSLWEFDPHSEVDRRKMRKIMDGALQNPWSP